MARIKIQDLPRDTQVSKDELRSVRGGVIGDCGRPTLGSGGATFIIGDWARPRSASVGRMFTTGGVGVGGPRPGGGGILYEAPPQQERAIGHPR